MEKIASFKIDHTIHDKGFYLGHVENNIFTYDLRFKK
ncbi:MAG: S-ribosylhomocysteine lyase, partial [Clostridiales bacterium]|nr:S-ribosylhomocysteine lyase [Clostridiales bacterium]